MERVDDSRRRAGERATGGVVVRVRAPTMPFEARAVAELETERGDVGGPRMSAAAAGLGDAKRVEGEFGIAAKRARGVRPPTAGASVDARRRTREASRGVAVARAVWVSAVVFVGRVAVERGGNARGG